jgi:hypothetical protein
MPSAAMRRMHAGDIWPSNKQSGAAHHDNYAATHASRRHENPLPGMSLLYAML